MTKPTLASCSIEGVKHLNSGLSEQDMCAKFFKQLRESLANKGYARNTEDLQISITLNPRGSAIAKIKRPQPDGMVEYPEVAVDVMDRPLREKDLGMLADAAAGLLVKQK